MEIYQSSKTAAEMEYALSAIPSIGANNHWFIGDQDTGVLAEGLTPYVGENGNWWVGETDSGIFAGGVKIEGTAEVGQTIVVKAVDENGKPTEWEPASKRTVYRGRIIKLLDHVFEEDIANTDDYDDGIGDMAFHSARIITTDDTGAPLKIRRLWYDIYWGTGSKDAANNSTRYCVPQIALCGHRTVGELRDQYMTGAHGEYSLSADRGSIGNNISDNQYRHGYIDWEKILGVEFTTAERNWKGTAANNSAYPSPSQVQCVLGIDYAWAVGITLPGSIKAGTTYRIWVEVAE